MIHDLSLSLSFTSPGLMLFLYGALHAPLECCQPGIDVLLFAVNTVHTRQDLGQVFLSNLVVLWPSIRNLKLQSSLGFTVSQSWKHNRQQN